MRLVNEWKECWRWLSVHCMMLAAAIQGGWECLSDDMKQTLPHGLLSGLTVALLILGVGGRLVKQSKNDISSK